MHTDVAAHSLFRIQSRTVGYPARARAYLIDQLGLSASRTSPLAPLLGDEAFDQSAVALAQAMRRRLVRAHGTCLPDRAQALDAKRWLLGATAPDGTPVIDHLTTRGGLIATRRILEGADANPASAEPFPDSASAPEDVLPTPAPVRSDAPTRRVRSIRDAMTRR